MKGVRELIAKYSLQNAIRYNGRANADSVLGKVLGKVKIRDIKGLREEIKNIIDEINLLSIEEQTERLKKLEPKLLEKKEEKKELPELKNKGNVVMRFAPSPSGPLHIGHAYVLGLNHAYCRKYKGKLILRIEDTNPENIYKNAYRMIEDDAKWLTGNKIAKTIIQSDRLELYYDYAEELIANGGAYVCTCDADRFRELASNKKECPCRSLNAKENLLRFDRMFQEYKAGEAVVRIKTNIHDPNPAMRDWPALRINEHEHPRTGKKYRVWPLMNFAVAVDDHELGVTHTIRGKDHMDNEKRQGYVYKYFKWKMPENLYVGRINFIGMELSASETRKLIEYGRYDGWDDIRLPFLAALRKKGYQAEAFIEYSLDIGINQADKTVAKEEFFKILNAHNKELIDKTANRYFFVENPVKIKIENAPKINVKIALHPDFKKRGYRNFRTSGEFYIAKRDYDNFREGKMYRLMDCMNIVKKNNKLIFDSRGYEKFRESGEQIIHWLPAEKGLVNVEVLMEDKGMKKGLGEISMKKLKDGDIVQLERFAFCKLAQKEKNKLIFWFTHK